MVEKQTLKARVVWALGMLVGAALLCLPALALPKSTDGTAVTPPPPPVATVAPGTVTGTVTDTGGAPLPAGTSVALTDPASGTQAAATTTSTDGSYALTNVTAGDYVLQVGQPGIAAVLQVADGARATTLDVVMPTVLVSPSLAGGPTPGPVPAMAAASDEGVTLVAAPILPAASSNGNGKGNGNGNGKVMPATSIGNGPTDKPNPGKPKPPAPPGRPPDKPLPPPFISVTSP